MFPLLPFVAGIATGALAVRYWRKDASKINLDQAQKTIRTAAGTAGTKLRRATVTGLEAIEHSSAAMRERLTTEKTAARSTTRKARAKKPAAKKAATPNPAAPKAEAKA